MWKCFSIKGLSVQCHCISAGDQHRSRKACSARISPRDEATPGLARDPISTEGSSWPCGGSLCEQQASGTRPPGFLSALPVTRDLAQAGGTAAALNAACLRATLHGYVFFAAQSLSPGGRGRFPFLLRKKNCIKVTEETEKQTFFHPELERVPMSDHLLSIASSRLVTPGMASAGPLFPAPMCFLVTAARGAPPRQPRSNKQPSKASTVSSAAKGRGVVWSRGRRGARQGDSGP